MHPPASHDLLPPLLACLPTAFASTRPPPALLPLLSPILRQRVQLLSDTSSSSSSSWLSKLSWDPAKAERLGSIVEGGPFELHPVSNEIEFGDAEILGYRRLDEETLQSRVDIRDLGLTVIYLWCEGDEAGGGDGWRVAEVLPLDEEKASSNAWSRSIEAANAASTKKSSTITDLNGVPPSAVNGTQPDSAKAAEEEEEEDADDDDYWAQYDNAPTSTPGPQPSPGPPPSTSKRPARPPTSEAEYFSRYSGVQPEMDADDPSTDKDTIGESSLDGNALTSSSQQQQQQIPSPPITRHLNHTTSTANNDENNISSPQPHPLPRQDPEPPTSTSSSAHSSAIIDKLEDSAEQQSQTEFAVRQHVASTMKSLWRLARGTGMEMGEFRGVVGREVEVLGVEEEMEGG